MTKDQPPPLTDPAANGDGGILVVSGDHDDANAGLHASLNGWRDFGSGWIQHAHHSDESDAALVVDKFGGIFEVHFRFGHGIVDATQSQAAKGVAASAPRVGHLQDTGLDGRRHGHLIEDREGGILA